MAFEFVSALAEQRYTECAKVLDASIAACDPGDAQGRAEMLVNRGYCHQRVQLYRKALKDYDAALEAVPRLPIALYRKGQVLAAQKKYEEARAVWNEALQACSERSDAQLVMDISAAIKDPTGVKAGLSAVVGPLSADVAKAAAPAAASTSSWAPATPNPSPSSNGGAAPAPAAPAPSSSSSATTSPADAAGPSKPAAPAAEPAAQQKAGAATAAPSTGRGGVASTSAPSSSSTSSSSSSSSSNGGAASKPSSKSASPPPPGPSKGPAAAASTASSSSSSKAAAAGAVGECDVEEVDCVAQQKAARAAAAGGPGGAASPDMQTVLNNSIAIQLAVTQINSGSIVEAEAILDKVLVKTPRELGARVARGTARALRRDLAGAVEDFGVAIEVEPRYADSWKRRGQARSALGDHEGALADLQKAIDLAPLFGGPDSAQSRAECYVEKGMIYQKMRDYRRACRELQQAVKLDGSNAQAWNVLGLCSTSQGDIRDGVRAYEKAVELNPKLKEGWVNMGQALKEEGRTKEAERVLLKALALDPPDQPAVHVLRVLAQMKQQKGEHAAAIKLLDRALPVAEARDEQVIEVLYLRAICYHALGAAREAVRDYDDCLGHVPKTGIANVSEEARQFQFLSFYQKDIALYFYHSLERRAKDFCPDSELPAVFKELWCKKGPPTAELISHFPPQPPLPLTPAPLPPVSPAEMERLRPLTAAADQLGVLLQNHHQGFLPNVRQQRAAGYAAVELAQALREVVAARRAGRQVWVRSEGSSGQAGSAGRHLFGWRDAMDIVVKWRQLSEPNDQVVWVDLLTRREFEQGFGSHTPMFSGQTKCVRYYMNFARALELQKEVLLREGHAFDANNNTIPVGSEAKRAAIRAARTAEDMYQVLQQDSWVVVPIHSVARADHMMEGTRLTLVRVPNQPDAYEFSIRTPVTPPRWKDFDAELEAAFEGILAAFAEDDLPLLASRIMTYCYYWYNFMPLARGTAAVGYTTMLGLFWGAGMPVTATIPKDYQVDWEAILAQHPDQFTASVSAWLYPPQARGQVAPAAELEAAAGGGKAPVFPAIDALPPVSEVLGTVRQRIFALNGENSKRYV
ncbi:hypothetical protein CHLRE_01g021450v5 [Chlamydomonas reinhardtii]|uniref:Cytochrome c-type biogenesis protein H TPR domain-containing protein n=1 Tax=Chlamydomonas reinhardtii TaxID=3055 RepID=A0A2K3E656_CHLRE|nr:uncharacterized protein CHLRE_01g021450v5 [Chlamydomonas reinhardtii]PNW88256.1 hypothetical protein CHLRE_01g021450v5 [Chlamydomonas reinhardtii]